MKYALAFIGLALTAYGVIAWTSCQNAMERRMNPPLSTAPPKAPIGAFRYKRPYSAKELIALAERVCQTVAEERNVAFASMEADLQTSRPDNRHWMFCKVFATGDSIRPVLEIWLKQDERDGDFIWTVHEVSGAPPPQ